MNRLKTRLFVLRPSTAFAGVVLSAPVSPFMTISWNNGATGTGAGVATDGAPIPGNTVWFGTTPNGAERGKVRLRSWSPAGGNPAAGQMSVAENSDVTPFVAAGDYVTIKQEFRLWSKSPRDVRVGESVTIYEDYDIAFANQTKDWYPVAVAPPPAVAKLAGGVATVKFTGNSSFANAPGSGISSWLWTAHGSDELTSTAAGDEFTPVVFTWRAEGVYLVTLKVTDTNGNSHTAHTWVFVYNESNPTIGYTKFDMSREYFDFSSGGGEADFTVFGNADVSEFPEGAMVVHAYEGTPEQTYADSFPFRENILFVGYITGAEITQSPDDQNTVTFKAATIDGLARNLSIFPVSLTDVGSPSSWVEASVITIDRFLCFLAQWRSTLAAIAPIVPLRYTSEIYRQDTGYQSLYDAMDSLARDGWARVGTNHQGVIHVVRDYQLMITGSERILGSTDLGTITSSDWIAPLGIVNQADYTLPVSQVRMDGVYYNGSTNVDDAQELFSDAPGIVPQSYGRSIRMTGLVLTSQTDLNTRCGLEFARRNLEYPTIRAQFINDLRFGVVPQQRATVVINANDNLRGLAWTATLIPRKVTRTYNHENGVIRAMVEFEPDSRGEPGVTVTKPPTPIVPDPTVTGTTDGLMTAASVYRWLNGETGWTQVASGTTYWLGNNENGVILRAGVGVVEKTTDRGNTWIDATPVTDPPNTWSDTPAPTVGVLAFHEVHPDRSDKNTWWLAANWQNTGSAWRTWLATSTGSSIDWQWV